MGERIPDSRKAIRKRMEWSGHRERETNVGKEIREVIRSFVRDMQTNVEIIYKFNLFNKLIVEYKPFYYDLSGKIRTFA